MLHKLGVESPDVDLRLLYAARKAPQFRFDWFLKSRSAKELYQRCQTIMNAFEYILDDKEVEALKEEREKLKSESQEKLNQQKVENKEDWNSETDSECSHCQWNIEPCIFRHNFSLRFRVLICPN